MCWCLCVLRWDVLVPVCAKVCRWSLLGGCSASGCRRRTCRTLRPPWNAPDLSRSSWSVQDTSSHLASVIITTIIIHHPVILPFQTQNFPISQILSSIDIWHLLGLISRIPGLPYGFFLFQFCLVFSHRYFFPFKFFCLRSLISPTVCFLIFLFFLFCSSI